jgi:hypothetical protein
MRTQFLCGMIVFYAWMILFFLLKCDKETNSISFVLCKEENQCVFLILLFLMGICTIFYEKYRKNVVSSLLLFLLIISIGTLLFFEEKSSCHLYLSYFIFICILLFMNLHKKNHYGLYLSFLLQCVLGIWILLDEHSFIIVEGLLLLNFAIYYICLHFIDSYSS